MIDMGQSKERVQKVKDSAGMIVIYTDPGSTEFVVKTYGEVNTYVKYEMLMEALSQVLDENKKEETK